MDKFMESHWFLKGIALIFALLLFLSFRSEGDPKGSLSLFTEIKRTEDAQVFTENYDQEHVIVSEVPQTVKITFEGPSSIVNPTILKKEYKVYVDLKDLPPGEHELELQVRNVSDDKLNISIDPKKIKVQIREKMTKKFPVSISYVNESNLKQGYMIKGATTKDESVVVEGPKEAIERVDKVKAVVDVKNADKSFEKEVLLVAYDKDGNPIPNLIINPERTKVDISINLPSKKVPVIPTKAGTAPEGTEIDSLDAEIKEVTIFGPQEVLNKVTSVPVEVNIGKIEESGIIEGNVLLPEGITRVSPEIIKVRVNVKKEQTQTVNNIMIKPIGLQEDLKVTFVSPSNGMITLDIFGFQDIIDSVTAKEIEAYVDVSKLSPGTYELPLQAKGPGNVRIDVQNKKVKFNIVKNEA
jgi:YbbR domain-containing protein